LARGISPSPFAGKNQERFLARSWLGMTNKKGLGATSLRLDQLLLQALGLVVSHQRVDERAEFSIHDFG
jgi:hypothetical protein